jgi:hypothetical protein
LWHFRPAAEPSNEDKTVRIWDFGRAARYIEFKVLVDDVLYGERTVRPDGVNDPEAIEGG